MNPIGSTSQPAYSPAQRQPSANAAEAAGAATPADVDAVLNDRAAIGHWCQQLDQCGHWHRDATALIARLLPGLPGWPDKPLEIMDLKSPASPHMYPAEAEAPGDSITVFRDAEGYYSGKARSTAPATLHTGGDGFLEALAEELERHGAWDTLIAAHPPGQGASAAKQLRHALATHLFDQTPPLIKTSVLPILGPPDPVEARETVARGFAEMIQTHNLTLGERPALVKLLVWRELARPLYPSAAAPDAVLRPPSGPDAEAHLARSVHLVLARARQAAGRVNAAAPASATAERDLAIAGDCARLLSKQWGPQAYAGLIADWADAPSSASFPTVPAPFLEMALCSADLRQADLRERNLAGLNLSSLCLAGADLSGSTITGASFKNADLTGANLCNAHARIFSSGVDFSGANLQGASLAGSYLFSANFTQASLCQANLHNANGHVMLDGTDLTDADLSGCGWALRHAKETILRGALLPSSVFVVGWRWHELDLTGAKVPAQIHESDLPRLRDQEQRDELLNHVENQRASRLSNIHRIPDPAVRVPMMRVLIEGLARVAAEDVSLSSNLPSLNDVLLRDPAYLREPSIRGFVDKYLMPALRDKAASGSLPWAAGADARRTLDDPVAIEYSLQHVRELLQEVPAGGERSEIRYTTLARLAAPLNQLLAAAQRHPSCAEAALALRQAWVERLDGNFTGLRLVMEAEGLEPLQAGTYVEVSGDGQQALAYEQPYMDRLESREGSERVSWGGAYRFEAPPDEAWAFIGGVGGQGRPLTADLQPFPWIQSRYIALNSDQIRTALLQTALGPGGTAPEGDLRELTAFLAQVFQSKSQPATAPRPWLSPDGRDKLHRIFAPLLQPTDTSTPGMMNRLFAPKAPRVDTPSAGEIRLTDQTRFTPAHTTALLRQIGHADPQAQARYVLALGHLFTYASSSAIMGTSSDSPNAVRAAAVACLNLAHDLDPTLLAEPAYGSQASVRQDWVDRLIGVKFSCTAILSNAMSDFVRTHPSDVSLTRAHTQVLPHAWR
jgi:uncharacterized protein YjbI with pentapeptide repeats